MSRAATSGLSNASSRQWAADRARCSVRTKRLRFTAAAHDAGSNAPDRPASQNRSVDPVAQLVVVDRLAADDVDDDEDEAVLLVVDEDRAGGPRQQRAQRLEHPAVVVGAGQRVADEELEQVGGVGGGVDPAQLGHVAATVGLVEQVGSIAASSRAWTSSGSRKWSSTSRNASMASASAEYERRTAAWSSSRSAVEPEVQVRASAARRRSAARRVRGAGPARPSGRARCSRRRRAGTDRSPRAGRGATAAARRRSVPAGPRRRRRRSIPTAHGRCDAHHAQCCTLGGRVEFRIADPPGTLTDAVAGPS